MTIESVALHDSQRIGPYRLLGILGVGRGFRSLLGVGPDGGVYVLQQVGAPLVGEPDFRLRWRHNAVAAMRITGVGNATVVDVDADDEQPWRASVFVPSARLDLIVDRQRPLSVPEVLALAVALATALRGVHAVGLAHRRVRPDTVALTRDGVRLAELGISPAPGAPPPGTTSKYLAPEQVHGVDPTPASDVYALGAVLAFAASGVPELDEVPEPLRELIGACMNAEPTARPTPVQILQYLEAAAIAQVWPPPVLTAIDRQEREVSALVATLATAIAAEPPPPGLRDKLASAATATTEFGGRSIESIRQRVSATTPVVRLGAAVGIVAVLLAAGFVATTNTTTEGPGESPTPTAAKGLSLDQLRQTDACTWLSQAMGESVPVAPTTLPKSTWKIADTPSWGCRATSGAYELELNAGTYLTGYTPQETVIDGIRLQHAGSGRCARAIPASGSEGPVGVVIELRQPPEVKDCRGIEYVAANLARTTSAPPHVSRQAASLALLSPCGLLTREVVTKAIGPTPPQPSVSDAHTCVWDGGAELTVRLSKSGTYTPAAGATTVVEGVRMYLDTDNPPAICTREYLDPHTNTETAAVTVRWTDGDREKNCPIAESMLRALVARLPH